MKKYVRFYLPLTVFLIFFVGQVISRSSGPPAGNTGAPGNSTCASSGCHNSFGLNTGSGQLSIETDIPQDGFLPGERYTVTVKMIQGGSTIFGFQTLPYGETTQEGVGTITITDTERTRATTVSSRTYAEHIKNGTTATDSAVWAFDWIAPADKGTGDVTIYAASVAANGNGNRQGDRVYTAQLQVSENPTATLDQLKEISAGNLYPNPTAGILSLTLELQEATPIRWSISDLQGRIWQTGETSTLTSNWNTQFDLTELPGGLYQLEIKTASGRWREKVVKR